MVPLDYRTEGQDAPGPGRSQGVDRRGRQKLDDMGLGVDASIAVTRRAAIIRAGAGVIGAALALMGIGKRDGWRFSAGAVQLDDATPVAGPPIDTGTGSQTGTDVNPPLSTDQQWAPGTFDEPDPPLSLFISSRTDTSITVRWLNPGGVVDRMQLQRRPSGGEWQTAVELAPEVGWMETTDFGVQPDTTYCYRVRVESPGGSATTPAPNHVCAHTLDANPVPIHRAQLRIRTADVEDAGTNGPISVRLNSPLATQWPRGNLTWLDYGPEPITPLQWIDDFARGRDFTYDLMLNHVSALSDLTMLSIGKTGTDGLAIAEVELIINGQPIFHKGFGDTAESAQWIDSGDGHQPVFTVFTEELRAHDAWQAWVSQPPGIPLTIPNEEIVSRIEAMVGHYIHGTPAFWSRGDFSGSAWVEATRIDDGSLAVDIDLGGDAGVWPDPEIDIDFDLVFAVTCEDEPGTTRLSISTTNLDVQADTDFIVEVLYFWGADDVEEAIANMVKQSFVPIELAFSFDTGGICPRVLVTESGDVAFTI